MLPVDARKAYSKMSSNTIEASGKHDEKPS